MPKTLLLIAILFWGVSSTIAQSKSNNAAPAVGLGLSYGFPQGANATTTPYAGGLILRLQQPVASRLSLILKTGINVYVSGDFSLGTYNSNPYLETPGTGTSWTFIPLEAGAKFFFLEKWYIEGDGGISLFLNYHPGGNKTVEPIVAYGLGYDIHFGPSKNFLDLGFNYDNRINNSSPLAGFSEVSFYAIFNFGQ